MPDDVTSVLIAIGQALRAEGYAFVTVTPETHGRVLKRASHVSPAERKRAALLDAFGWSRPFEEEAVPAPIVALLRRGGLLTEVGGRLVSRVRFSSLEGGLYAHSAFPTHEKDAVFFGPDTYRFCRAIRQAGLRPRVVVDVGCGAGAGGLVAGRAGAKVVLADLSPRALVFARANAALQGAADVTFVESDVLAAVHEAPDLVVANPPYLVDAMARTYRDGGGRYGEALALRIVSESLARLAPGGTLLLYTGSAIVGGTDTFLRDVTRLLEGVAATMHYEELDPDVFGEELETPAYAEVDRIAAVLLHVTLG